MAFVSGLRPRQLESPVDGIAEKDEQKQNALQDRDGGVRQIVRALQHAAAGEQAADQQRNQNDAERVLAREKRHQNADVSITRVQRFVGAPVHGGNFHHARNTRAGAAEKTRDHNEPSDRQARELRRPHIAAGDLHGEAEGGALDQEPCQQARDEAEDQAVVNVSSAEIRQAGDPASADTRPGCSGWMDRA